MSIVGLASEIMTVITLLICSTCFCTVQLCSHSQYTVLFENGTLSNCADCPTCQIGTGLTVECGSTISTETRVGCNGCISGLTYNDIDLPTTATCKPCDTQEHRKILQRCTSTQNAIYANACLAGYYFSQGRDECIPSPTQQSSISISTIISIVISGTFCVLLFALFCCKFRQGYVADTRRGAGFPLMKCETELIKPGDHEMPEGSISKSSIEYQIWGEIVGTPDYHRWNKELTYSDPEESSISKRRDLLAERVSDLPLRFLGKICALLNDTIEMLPDYVDLGERLNLKTWELRTFKRLENPTSYVLLKFDSSTDGTVRTFIKHLEALKRQDVIDVISDWMDGIYPFQNNGETKAQRQRCQINKPSERLVPDTPGCTDVHLKNSGFPVNVPDCRLSEVLFPLRYYLYLQLDFQKAYVANWRDVAKAFTLTKDQLRGLEIVCQTPHASPTETLFSVLETRGSDEPSVKDLVEVLIELGRSDIVENWDWEANKESDPWTGKKRNALKRVKRFEGNETSATSDTRFDNRLYNYIIEKDSGDHELPEDSVSTSSTEYQIGGEILVTSDYRSITELTFSDPEESPISKWRDLLPKRVSDLPLRLHWKICVLLNGTINMVADYRDLGERLGLETWELRRLKWLQNPAAAVLQKFDSSTDGTVGTFIGHLEALGREDVINVIYDWMDVICPFQNNGETKAQGQRCQINKPSERLLPDPPGPTDVHLKNSGLPVNLPAIEYRMTWGWKDKLSGNNLRPRSLAEKLAKTDGITELDDKHLNQSSSEKEERRKRLELNRGKLMEFHRRFCNNKRKLKESITSKLKSLSDVVAVRRGVNTECSATSKYAGATINIFVKCDRQQFLAKHPEYDEEPYVIMKHSGGRIIDQVFDGQLIYCAEQSEVPHLGVEQNSTGTVGYWIPERNNENSLLGVTAFHALDFITENTGIDNKTNFQSYVYNCRENCLKNATYPLGHDSECLYVCGLYDNLFDVGVVRHHGVNQQPEEDPFQWPSILYELVVAEDYDLIDILQDYQVRSGEAVHVFHNGQSSTEDERKVGELSDVLFDIGLDEHGKTVESESSVISVEGAVVNPSDFSFLEFEVLEQMYQEFQSESDESETDSAGENQLNNNCESPTTSLAGDLSTSASFSDEGAEGCHSSSDDIVQFMPRERSLDSGIANLYFTHPGDSGCIYYIYIKRDNQLWKAPIAIHRCLYEGSAGQHCSIGSSIGQALMKIKNKHNIDAWFDVV